MGHENLGNFFKTNFALVQHHKWSLSDIESMMPWEKYIYIDLLQAYIKAEEEKIRDINMQNRAAGLKRVKM